MSRQQCYAGTRVITALLLIGGAACDRESPMEQRAERALARALGPDVYFTAQLRSHLIVLRIDTVAFRRLDDSAFARRAAELSLLAVDSTGNPSQFDSVAISASGWMRRGLKDTTYRHCTFAVADLRSMNVSPASCSWPSTDSALTDLQRADTGHVTSARGLTGRWRQTFVIDHMRRSAETEVDPPRRASGDSVQGWLELRDSLVSSPWIRGASSAIEVDFQPLLGRPMSCFDPRPTATGVERSATSITLYFTPGAADCGFVARGRLFGDSLIVGQWHESAFAGVPAGGRFVMRRVR